MSAHRILKDKAKALDENAIKADGTATVYITGGEEHVVVCSTAASDITLAVPKADATPAGTLVWVVNTSASDIDVKVGTAASDFDIEADETGLFMLSHSATSGALYWTGIIFANEIDIS